MKGMILAAGLGTRLKPFTESHPKALLPINGKTLLQRNIEYLQSFNVKDVVVNVHHFASQIKDAIQQNNAWGSNITISDETDMVLETGGGLKKAAVFLQDSIEPFVLMNADILTDLNIDEIHNLHLQSNVLATLAVTNRSTSRYLLFDDNNNLCGWKNEITGEQKGKPGTKKAFSGIHVISPKIFQHTKEGGKFSMIDLYLRLALEGFKINCYDHSNGKLLDVGKPESVLIAEKIFL